MFMNSWRDSNGSTESEKRMDVYGVREKGDSICVGRKAAAWQVSKEKGGQTSFLDGESENVGMKCQSSKHQNKVA